MNRKRNIILAAFIVLLIAWGLYNNTRKHGELSKNSKMTTGKIISYRFIRQTQYKLEYEYTVSGVKYTDNIVTSRFGCDNKNDGCVGRVFTIIYSENEPEVSDIDLGVYNEFKELRPHF